MSDHGVVYQTFRALVESADRKFARVRDLPAYGRVNSNTYFQKVFKAYTRLWKYQQENRAKLVQSGLNRWEIGEIASRIAQLYFNQYMRTSESRFLVEAYVFYAAILDRKYFEGSTKNLGVRFKELRFYARFLLVSLILNRNEMVKHLTERFMALLEESKTSFPGTNFKEWKQVVQEIVRFMKVDNSLVNVRPLRYVLTIDSRRSSFPYVARFHAKRKLSFQDAILSSYHPNEVKFAEHTLDTFRMIQCLEWEPSGSFYRKQAHQLNENGGSVDHSGASGAIDMNLAVDMTDPTLPANPRKAILYRPSVTHLVAVLATVCDELPPDGIILLYLSASGKGVTNNAFQMEASRGSLKSSKNKVISQNSKEEDYVPKSGTDGKRDFSCYYNNHLWFGSRGSSSKFLYLIGSNNLYPGDIIPFTRKPLFLIIDSDNSHAFKVLHGAERGETAALFLSPLSGAFKNSPSVAAHQGSQFTSFLTAPLSAFCQMIGISPSLFESEIWTEAENIISESFGQWEVILCTSTSMDLVWAQILNDPFLRRLILRFIFCRSVLFFFCLPEQREHYLPVCLPSLPKSVAPDTEAVSSVVIRLAKHLKVTETFPFQ